MTAWARGQGDGRVTEPSSRRRMEGNTEGLFYSSRACSVYWACWVGISRHSEKQDEYEISRPKTGSRKYGRDAPSTVSRPAP
jgi:hypothetical protein